jgi:hypothetical protein
MKSSLRSHATQVAGIAFILINVVAIRAEFNGRWYSLDREAANRVIGGVCYANSVKNCPQAGPSCSSGTCQFGVCKLQGGVWKCLRGAGCYQNQCCYPWYKLCGFGSQSETCYEPIACSKSKQCGCNCVPSGCPCFPWKCADKVGVCFVYGTYKIPEQPSGSSCP